MSLAVFGYKGVWAIAWEDDEGYEGLYVGDLSGDEADIALQKRALQEADEELRADIRSNLECAVVQQAVRELSKTFVDGNVFLFETQSSATAALRVAKTALKNIDVPMPSWATQALAAGWKPPKGWKP